MLYPAEPDFHVLSLCWIITVWLDIQHLMSSVPRRPIPHEQENMGHMVLHHVSVNKNMGHTVFQ